MKKIFKKLAGLIMGLLVIGGLAGIGASSNEAPVKAEAANAHHLIYISPGSTWLDAGARIELYYWFSDGTDGWDTFDRVGQYYKAELPKNFTGFKFVRSNPKAAQHSWDSKWNESGDFTTFDPAKPLLIKNNGWYDTWTAETTGISWSAYNPGYILFYNTSSWTTVNAYMWDKNNSYNVAWPGESMIYLSSGNKKFWYYEYDLNKSYNKVIFNNGSTKTGDLTLNKNQCYVFKTNKWYSFTLPVVASIKNETIKFTMKDYIADASVTDVLSFNSASTGYSKLSVNNGGFYLDYKADLTTNEKQSALNKYMANVDTCNDYLNVAEYTKLTTGLDNSVVITDKGGNVTIDDKIKYMTALFNKENPSSPLGNNLLSNISSNNNIAIILIIGLLGLATIGGYYFLNKKKYAK